MVATVVYTVMRRIVRTQRSGLEIFTPGASLGGVESLVEVPSLMIPDEVGHGSATADIPESLVRMSVGIEHVDDLCEDLRSALS